MPEIVLRVAKGSALTQTEMDNNLRYVYNSSSVDPYNGTLSLFTSESSGAQKEIQPGPSWVNYSGSINGTNHASITGSLVITENITAQEFHTEFVSSSILHQSGSTKFGDDSQDLHQFSGSIDLTGSLETSGSFTLTNTGSTSMTVKDGYIILTEVLANNYANDSAAETGGVPVGGLYRNGNFVQIRLT